MSSAIGSKASKCNTTKYHKVLNCEGDKVACKKKVKPKK